MQRIGLDIWSDTFVGGGKAASRFGVEDEATVRTACNKAVDGNPFVPESIRGICAAWQEAEKEDAAGR